MLRTFAERIPGLRPESWTTHVAGHPPGALLVFVGLDRIGLPGGAPAALLCVVVGSTAAVAVAVTLRALGAESTARAALPFGVLLPWRDLDRGVRRRSVRRGAGLGSGSASRRRHPATARHHGYPATSAAGGLLLGATLFLSYGLVLAGLLPVAVAVAARRVAPLLVAGAGVAAVVAAFAVAGFWWLDGYRQVTVRYYQPGEYGLVRPYGYWVWADLACLVVVLGPAGVAGLRRVFTPGQRQPRVLVLLCAAAAVAVLVADLSGLSKAEVERIWLPFAVWLIAATGLLPGRQVRWWLVAQAAVALTVNHLLLMMW